MHTIVFHVGARRRFGEQEGNIVRRIVLHVSSIPISINAQGMGGI